MATVKKVRPARAAPSGQVLFVRDCPPLKVRRLRSLAAARSLSVRDLMFFGLLPMYEAMLSEAKAQPDGVAATVLNGYGLGAVDV